MTTAVRCTLLGHRYRFSREGAELRWSCSRCARPGGSKLYGTPDDAERYAAAFNREDRQDLGRRAPLIGLLPLRLYRALQRR